jgi:TRAP-type mannitol/chloroaromatic compound transport system substrate-binding protein
VVAKRVAAATGGKFQIQVFAAGEIVPGPGVLDAVKDGTVECGHTCSYYFIGKDPTFAFDTAVPFGLNSRQQTAWMMEGGGLELFREFFKDYNIHNIPCGNTGAQMGGWFRKEIKTVEDLKGLKFRCGGFAGQVLAKLGVVPQQIPGGDIYPALEKGTIDAAEWIGPYDDQKLGFNKVAKYYYYPGFWEGGPQISLYVNQKQWAALPKEYQTILEDACLYAHAEMQARYDAKNPTALKQLIGSGTQLRPFPNEVMAAAYKAAHELYDETAAKNPSSRRSTTAGRNSATTSSSGSPWPRTASTTSCRPPAAQRQGQEAPEAAAPFFRPTMPLQVRPPLPRPNPMIAAFALLLAFQLAGETCGSPCTCPSPAPSSAWPCCWSI